MGAARLRITSFPTANPDAAPWLGDRWYRIASRNSGKVLGVDGISTANSAHVVQYDDNGTADHLWHLL
nr:RICIN domain-containing protein [Streptomyces sp. SM10]